MIDGIADILSVLASAPAAYCNRPRPLYVPGMGQGVSLASRILMDAE